jgi:hypothetical protein
MATLGGFRERVTLWASSTITATTAGTAVKVDRFDRALFFFDLTALGTAAADKLDVYIQILLPDGTTWHDIAAFTQIDGDGSAVQEILQWSDAPTPEVEKGAPSEAALAEGTVSQGGLTGSQIRVYAKVTDDTTPTFTFSVTAHFAERGGGL